MKKFILASAILLALVGCESSTSSSDTALKCNVTRSANSVKIVESMMDGAYYYESTVTVKLGNDGYYYSEIVSKETVPDAGAAAENCAEEREEATHWLDGSYQVQCYGNTVETHEVSSDADLDKREEEFNYLCKISERAGEEGLEDYEDWD
ncbi:hypothetical protein [Fibrobacter sp. UWB12]|uniref:hypothetical protein n=1 Tax=Fibrobacter sp. UWB12 TaxID=1896203 RepID=UPI0009107DAF|nr:hypothetical protein [Fibrobacter sp. UWB12]SHK75480.1 hypothetical protein SAMN05720759_10666 [Fibrobacter sp. UWB12]